MWWSLLFWSSWKKHILWHRWVESKEPILHQYSLLGIHWITQDIHSQGHDWVFAWNSLLFMVILANIVKQNQFTTVNSCWRTHKFSSYAYINWFSLGQFSSTEIIKSTWAVEGGRKLEHCNAPSNGMPLRALGDCLIN